jgi:hypothetical protein
MVARFFGQLARSTASARVGGIVGVVVKCIGSDMGVMWERYVWRCSGASGAPGAHSKRKRLDVGVLSYYFVLVFLVWVGSSVDFLNYRLVSLFGLLRFGFGSLVECFLLGYLVGWVIGFLGRLYAGSSRLIIGGGGC